MIEITIDTKLDSQINLRLVASNTVQKKIFEEAFFF